MRIDTCRTKQILNTNETEKRILFKLKRSINEKTESVEMVLAEDMEKLKWEKCQQHTIVCSRVFFFFIRSLFRKVMCFRFQCAEWYWITNYEATQNTELGAVGHSQLSWISLNSLAIGTFNSFVSFRPFVFGITFAYFTPFCSVLSLFALFRPKVQAFQTKRTFKMK